MLNSNSDPYAETTSIYDRLISEYNKHGSLVIGVDFDNTVYDYHNKGHTYPRVIEAVKSAANLGFTICAYTANEDTDLVVSTFDKLGIPIHHYNTSPIVFDSPKPFFSLLLDDRAGLGQSLYVLERLLQYIEDL